MPWTEEKYSFSAFSFLCFRSVWTGLRMNSPVASHSNAILQRKSRCTSFSVWSLFCATECAGKNLTNHLVTATDTGAMPTLHTQCTHYAHVFGLDKAIKAQEYKFSAFNLLKFLAILLNYRKTFYNSWSQRYKYWKGGLMCLPV